MSEDVQTLLGSARFGNLDEIVEYLMNDDYFYPDINYICERLKKNSLNYPTKVCKFQKNLLEIKKEFPERQKKKNNLVLIKNITCLIKKNFFCCLAP